MANYSSLKAAIQEVIKTNGNKEITGQLLQNSLVAMVNSLGAGYQFAGVAVPSTNPGTPDYNVFYFAGPGTYPNFNNATIPARNVGLLSYNGTWHVSSIQTTPFSAQSIADGIIQLMDGDTPVYPRTKAEAVFFDNDTTKTLDKEFSETIFAQKKSVNLYDYLNKEQVSLIGGANNKLVSYNGAVSYIIPVPASTVITIDNKNEGNKFTIYTTETHPENNSTYLRSISVSPQTAMSHSIETAANEHYIVLYVALNQTVTLSQMRVYAGLEWHDTDITKLDAEIGKITTDKFPKILFDASKDSYEVGYITEAGAYNSNSNWIHSDYIKVQENHKYKFYVSGFIAAYDNTKTIISGGGYTGGGQVIDIEFTTPSGCAFLIVSGKISGVARGGVESVVFMDLEPTYSDLENGMPPLPLVGKKIVCFGDSITGLYRAGWPLKLQEITGAITYNVGFGGCRMSVISGDGGTNPFSMAKLADAIISGDWTEQENSPLYSGNVTIRASLDLLKTIDFDTIDCILIAYGTNEFGRLPMDNENDPEDITTYAGAYRYALHKLMEEYPQLTVVALTPIYRKLASWDGEDSDTHVNPTYGGKLTDNVNTLISVSNELKVKCIDLYHTMSVNKYNYLHYYIDGTHLNFNGFDRYASCVAQDLFRIRL